MAKHSGGTAGVVLGVGATAAALGVGEFTGMALADLSLVVAVGDVVVDVAPGSLVRRTIGLLGTAQKPILLTGIVCISLLLGGGVGANKDRGRIVFGLAGIVGAVAALRSGFGLRGVATAALAATSGIYLLAVGHRKACRLDDWMDQATEEQPTLDPILQDPRVKAATRRGFLGYASGLTMAGGALVVGSRVLAGRTTEPYRSQVVLPTSRRTDGDRPAPTSTEAIEVYQNGLSPWITPNDDFYRIDTALMVPRVDPADWTVRIDGLVDSPLEFTLQDLLARDLTDAAVTLACVSNEVGGDLVGNAVWTGVPLAELLEEAGVQGGAEQIMGRSVDGFSAGFPRSELNDGRTAMVAVGMNGEPLPFRHGFPARLVVAGLYGYVSAVKWLEQIELTTMSVDGYWIPRGWAKEAPIKIASRIDVPTRSFTTPGRQAVAGVAWAPTNGVAEVELAIDDGPWTKCRLKGGNAAGKAGEAWVQWSTVWDAIPGNRRLRVRAWDRNGIVQPVGPKYIAPDGAEGYHTRQVLVA
ncbi:MAG: molybdopterin-dependent oxidoreductase [Acidimicrobiales bacterium]|nr:molybdopterin-dependent oxidoreductase [Acidimicrobiales bacterium]